MTQQAIRAVNSKGDTFDIAEQVRLAHADTGFSMVNQERYELGGRFFFSVTVEVKGHYFSGDAEIQFDATNPIECAQVNALSRALDFAGYGALEDMASTEETHHTQTEAATAQSPVINLNTAIKRAKKRALALGIATNAEEWQTLLANLNIEQIATPVDLVTIDEYLTLFEQDVKSA